MYIVVTGYSVLTGQFLKTAAALYDIAFYLCTYTMCFFYVHLYLALPR